ncbi:traB domain-containing protein isoform X2 [Amborella trichopoda]|uniref:traB domain-containing protein isoform X2 n=1 Tax=Amborella trichopoda TaxID=13333 RepID=UPI0005D323A7|nr:traB domain-containing protein isoform X2 [Amborella trichopoda]|eukprot:XP_011627595.1 traB domain-containing protein isoform X2 [Amborella trichopoda]
MKKALLAAASRKPCWPLLPRQNIASHSISRYRERGHQNRERKRREREASKFCTFTLTMTDGVSPNAEVLDTKLSHESHATTALSGKSMEIDVEEANKGEDIEPDMEEESDPPRFRGTLGLHESSNGGNDAELHDGWQTYEKMELPEDLAKGVVLLNCESSVPGGTCDVYLVGTAHVSQESCREVQAIIRFLKPQVVFLELCPSRVSILTTQNLKVPSMNDMIDMWRKKKMNALGIMYSWFLAKAAETLEVLPGSEFRIAYEEAVSYGAKVILGDRPVHLAQMNDADMLTLVIQEMSKVFPSLMETLVFERDLYMSSTLNKVASEHASVVAVVGKGHVLGIKKNWGQPVPLKTLLEVPAKRSSWLTMKAWTALGVSLTGAAVLSAYCLSCKR